MNIEKTTAYITYGIALTSASIYCFSLGYLDFFKIIDYPSWLNSHVFFFSTILSKGTEVFYQKPIGKLDISATLSTVAAVISLTFMIATEFYRIKDKLSSDVHKAFLQISNFVAIFGSLILSALIVAAITFIFKETIIFALPVLMVPLASLFFGMTLVERIEKAGNEKSIAKNTKLDDLSVFAVTLLIVWFMPYQMGHITASKLNPAKSFPKAWSGSKYGSSDYLVWKEDSKGFWLNCKEKVIYGITNEGNVFFSRNSSVLDGVDCK